VRLDALGLLFSGLAGQFEEKEIKIKNTFSISRENVCVSKNYYIFIAKKIKHVYCDHTSPTSIKNPFQLTCGLRKVQNDSENASFV
jgi:hypothetical protein